MAKDGSEYWESVVAKLEADRAALAGKEAAAATEARALALPAATGDAKAAAALVKVNARRNDLGREAETLDAALADAGGQLTAARGAEAAASQAARLGRLREGTDRLVALAGEKDAKSRQLAQIAGEFYALVEALRREGMSATVYNRLNNKTMKAGALHLAGLGALVQLQPVSPHHRKTFREWTEQMVALDFPPVPVQPAAAAAE